MYQNTVGQYIKKVGQRISSLENTTGRGSLGIIFTQNRF